MKRCAYILFIMLIAAGLIGGGVMNRALVDQRRTHRITQADPLVNAPPLVVFTTVALGGFRGMVADMLWIRAANLQQQGNYFELVQLADWITKLEPRFTEVWAYHAWNLAYNVSILFDDAADRWRWIRHGIELLRDEGLKYNPGDPGLLYELGWLFQHKIGSDMDEGHWYYKKAWAAEMKEALGSARMEQVYKIDPERMRFIDAQYGPLDWRLPQAHSLYWAAGSRELARSFDALMAQRMMYQSLVFAFRNGRLFTGRSGDLFVTSPSLDLWPNVIKAYEEAIAHPEDRGSTLPALHYFLQEAIFYLYLYDQRSDAESCLAKLKEMNPDLSKTVELDAFFSSLMTNPEMSNNRDVAFALVESFFYRAEIARRAGQDALADEAASNAANAWREFMEKTGRTPSLVERIGLPPLEQIQQSAAARLP